MQNDGYDFWAKEGWSNPHLIWLMGCALKVNYGDAMQRNKVSNQVRNFYIWGYAILVKCYEISVDFFFNSIMPRSLTTVPKFDA